MDPTLRKHAGAALVAVAVVVAALVDGSFGPTAYAAASILIWAAVIAGLAGRALPSSPIPGVAAAAGICLGALALLAGLSMGWATDQGRAFDEAVRGSTYLGLFTLAACTASPGGRRQWLDGLTVGLAVVVVLALLSRLQPGLLEDGELGSLIPAAADRLSFPIGYWNGLAALLAAAVLLLAHAAADANRAAERSAAVGMLPLALLAIWWTDSRGGEAATLVGLTIMVAASPRRTRQLARIAIGGVAGAVLIAVSERIDGDGLTVIVAGVALLTAATARLLDGLEPRFSRRLAIGLAAAAVLLAAVAIVASDPVQRFDEFKQAPVGTGAGAGSAGNDFNSSGRWQFWGEAVQAFESAPVAGIGAGSYEDWWAQRATIDVFVRNPHSLPLQQASELGVLGALLLAGVAAAIGLAAFRRLSRARDGEAALLVALPAAAAVSAAFDWTWAIPAVAAPAVIASALLTASAPGRTLSRDGYWLGLATVAAAWVGMVAGGLLVLSELKLEQSREAAAGGRLDQAVDRAQEAETVLPFSPEPYTQLALIEEQRGEYDEALESLRQAQRRDSEDWRLAQIEARLQLGRGDVAAAEAAVERAQALSPRSPILNP